MGLLDSTILLFAIVDAPGNLPIFIELTADMAPTTRRKAYDIATVAGLAVLVVFSLVGRFVLTRVFQISVSEFQIAGGVLLVAVGVKSMLGTGRDARGAAEGLEVAAVPMACPLLVGPGAIVTTMLIVERSGVGHAMLAAGIVFALARVIFWLAEPLRRLIGRLGLMILSRIMHIFIVAIGVHFVLAGIRAAFKLGG
jgi:multiple antibiotic resistance protein